MSEKPDKLKKEFEDLFEKSVLPAIKKQIESRNKARDRVNDLASRVESIAQEILDLTAEAEKARTEVVSAGGNQESLDRVIKLKERIRVLQEIKEEIETKTLDDCRMELEEAQQTLQMAAIVELNKIRDKEREKMVKALILMRQRMEAYENAKYELANQVLKMPHKYHLGLHSELYIEGMNGLILG